MDTIITIKVVSAEKHKGADHAMKRAFAAFHQVEKVFSRFDPESEISRLTRAIGKAVPVSPMLFEALHFSLEVAERTNGSFDPAIGHEMEKHGFNQHYLTGYQQKTPVGQGSVSFRDIQLHPEERTVLIHRPLVIDLGAVVKGLAIDLAARELSGFDGFFINAGGDIYAGGSNVDGELWRTGIRHPQQENKILCALNVSNQAICTSGRYERISPVNPNVHHLIDPKSGESPVELWSCTVIAPYAMLADTFSTAAFIQGADQGMRLLEEEGLDGLFVKSSMRMEMTKGMEKYGYECP